MHVLMSTNFFPYSRKIICKWIICHGLRTLRFLCVLHITLPLKYCVASVLRESRLAPCSTLSCFTHIYRFCKSRNKSPRNPAACVTAPPQCIYSLHQGYPSNWSLFWGNDYIFIGCNRGNQAPNVCTYNHIIHLDHLVYSFASGLDFPHV